MPAGNPAPTVPAGNEVFSRASRSRCCSSLAGELHLAAPSGDAGAGLSWLIDGDRAGSGLRGDQGKAIDSTGISLDFSRWQGA